MSTLDEATLMVAYDAWLEKRDHRAVLSGNGISNDPVPEDCGCKRHVGIELDWIIAEEERRRRK